MLFGLKGTRLMDVAGDGDSGNSGTAAEAVPPVVDDVSAELPNAAVKSHPLFQKLAQETAALRKAEADRQAADEAARAEAERKALEERGNYDEAIQQRDAEIARIKAEHAAEVQSLRLSSELARAGFDNDTFIKGAIVGYDAETHGEISEYVQTLAADENNAPFLATIGTGPTNEPTPRAPGKPPVNGGDKTDWNAVAAMEKSDDPQKRREARELLRRYRETHGKYPY